MEAQHSNLLHGLHLLHGLVPNSVEQREEALDEEEADVSGLHVSDEAE